MRVAQNRQLAALIAALLSALVFARGADTITPAERLLAAQLAEAALAARDASPAEWQSLSATYDTLAKANPDDLAILNAHGEYLWNRGEHQRAVAEWAAAEKRDPANAAALGHLGSAALVAGQAREAAGYYRRVVAAHPADAAGHFALANVVFLFRHQLAEPAHPDDSSLLHDALDHFATAAQLDPANADYARAYAETFYSVPGADWAQAVAAWEKVRDLDSGKDFALINLARVHLKLRHFDASKACLDAVENVAFQRVKARLQQQLAAASTKGANPPTARGELPAAEARKKFPETHN